MPRGSIHTRRVVTPEIGRPFRLPRTDGRGPFAVKIPRTGRMNQFVRLSITRQRRRATAIAIACGILPVLPSCGIPAHRKPVPVAPLPESFNGATSPENSSRACAEEFFHDPKLLFLIDQALTGN